MSNPTDNQAKWHRALHDLVAWHDRRDRERAEVALRFLEPRLRHFMPPAARRRWPTQQTEEAIQAFLERLLARPLPDAAFNAPAAYLRKSFQHWCIDIQRQRKREPTEPWEDEDHDHGDDVDYETRQAARAEVRRTMDALGTLEIPDRVAIKLVDAPSQFDDDELAWLCERTQRTREDILAEVLACPDVYDLTMIFDPGPEPRNKKERRDRMERFRKRRARARERLRTKLGGDA